MSEVEIRMICIFDDYVQMPDGSRISHAEYSAMSGQDIKPGPMRVNMDWRNPYVRMVFH